MCIRTVAVLMMALLGVVGCSSPAPELAGPWRDADGEVVAGFGAGRGDDDHCDWGSVTSIEVPTSVLPAGPPDDPHTTFVKDPEHLIFWDRQAPRTYASAVPVPDSARPLGVEDPSGEQLWYDEETDALYLGASRDQAQRLPRGDVGCD